MDWIELDYEYNWLEWNGNREENIRKVRAQVLDILASSKLSALRGKLARKILEVVENAGNKI